MVWLHQFCSGTKQASALLAFVAVLGAHDEWLAIRDVELEAVGSNQVRWSVVLWYFKEVAPNAVQ